MIMRKLQKKFRVIIRPWEPRKIPYEISQEIIDAFMNSAYQKIGKVLYLGWCKRISEKKKKIIFLGATGNTSQEARKAFKKSEQFGEDVWIIS